MARTVQQEAAHTKKQFLKRVIASAFVEGASAEAIDAHLIEQGVANPDTWRLQVRVMPNPKLLGKFELEDLGGIDAFRALFGLGPKADDAPAAAALTKKFDPCTIDHAHTVFHRWFGPHYDRAFFDAMLAALAAGHFGGDRVWLLGVGGPGDGKTETVQSAAGAGAIVTSTIASEGALLSGTSKKERDKDSTGGLLKLVGDNGTIVIKDVTSILSMNREARAVVMAAFREIHDGKWQRNVGSGGGQTLTWTGALTILGAVTTEWDQAHAAIASCGDRFVLVRLNSTVQRQEKGEQAFGNIGHETTMREELCAAVGGVIAGMNHEPITLTDAERDQLLTAADLVTWCRTGVITDFKGDVINAHMPEAPTRFLKQLAQIVRGACAIGITRDEAMNLAIRCARDSMPPLRLEILDYLRDEDPEQTGMKLSDIWRGVQKPRNTVKRHLDALHILGVLVLDEVERDEEPTPGEPAKSDWFYRLGPKVHIDAVLIPTGSGYVGVGALDIERERKVKQRTAG